MKNFRIVLLSGISLVIFGFTFLQSTENQEPKTSLLWKIEGNGLKNPSYLFGTMHMIQKDYFYFPSALEKIIKKSELVLTEIALNEMGGDQQKMMQYIYLKDGKLVDFFNQKQQDTLYNWAKSKLMMDKAGFDAAFGKMKPFVIVQTVMQLNLFGKTESYELKIKEVADKAKIPFSGFETIAEQMSFFDNLSMEKQALMVMESIRDEEKSIALTNNMQGIYRRQQLDSLYYIIKSEGGVITDDEEVFLTKRNANWIPKIKETIANKKTFIAVGAGHLAGEKGVIELLRKEGYTVTPIQF
ncbi:MAG: TraB/GumN family protein [Flavobacteriia bacterium]|jgi:uncharacterized protein YbaP (TraB family)